MSVPLFLPPDTRVALDPRLRVAANGVVVGGTPWGIVRLGPVAWDVVRQLQDAGQGGLCLTTPAQRLAADRLVARGLAHPLPPAVPPVTRGADGPHPPAVQVVVPAYGRPQALAACLQCLDGLDVVVVDDASPDDGVAAVAAQHGARLVRHATNRGPAAARNTGFAATTAPVVAFVDSDCRVRPGWLDALLPLFADARVGAVAPRILTPASGSGLLPRYEATDSALDLGPRRDLVRYGGAIGFVPSATLLVRRAAVPDGPPFDEDMRVGEDVDFVWRLDAAGWMVRYEPDVHVEHAGRYAMTSWLRRRFDYGTSATALDRRHPARLAPVRASSWNLATMALLLARRPLPAAALSAGVAVALGVRLRRLGVRPGLAAPVAARGLLAECTAVGHALRREWWPAGWLLLMAAPWRGSARPAAAAMLLPLVGQWHARGSDIDVLRYLLLRLAADAAYGSGVLVSAVSARRAGGLIPQVRGIRPPGRPPARRQSAPPR